MQITVIGSSGIISRKVWDIAEEVGRRIAESGAILVCGGRDGVMEAACKGAKDAGGLTVGILPYSKDEANPYLDVIIITGMGEARNVINVKSGDVVISIAGGAGTLSEIALALKLGKKVIAIKDSGGVSEMLAGKSINNMKVIEAKDAKEAIDLALKYMFS
jgi:hypothetical protein